MGSPVLEELEILYKYAKNSKFIIETGGGGESTKWLAKAALENNAIMVSIEANKKRVQNIDGVISLQGWSVSFEDIIKNEDPLFCKSRYPNQIDEKLSYGKKHLMKGKTDLIRKTLDENDADLDFFFCDTGEYCGIAEWRIVKDRIKVGGYFAAHDIYYPKSTKCFQVCKMIEESDEWEVLEKTTSRQGMLVSRKNV